MKLMANVKTLWLLLIGLLLCMAVSACGTGGEADTDAPEVTLDKLANVSTLVRTRALSGTVEPGATVEVTADTKAVPGPVTVNAGTWNCSIDLVPGVNTISVKATDATGNNKTLVFALTYEVFTLDQVLLSTSVQGQTLSGTLASGASLTGKLTRTSDGVEMQDIPAITASNWTQTLNVLADDTYTLTLTGTDDILQRTTLPLTLVMVIDSSLPVVTVNPASPVGSTVAIDGTVATDSAISEVRLNGVVVDLATVIQDSGSGTWSITLSDLQSGRNQIDITATRAADSKQASARLFVLYQP